MGERINTHVWECAELEFVSEKGYDNPFLGVELKVEFRGPNGERLLVPGFWDGDNLWRARFASTAEGEWSWKSACSNTLDKGLNGKVGYGRHRRESKPERLYKSSCIG